MVRRLLHWKFLCDILSPGDSSRSDSDCFRADCRIHCKFEVSSRWVICYRATWSGWRTMQEPLGFVTAGYPVSSLIQFLHEVGSLNKEQADELFRLRTEDIPNRKCDPEKISAGNHVKSRGAKIFSKEIPEGARTIRQRGGKTLL